MRLTYATVAQSPSEDVVADTGGFTVVVPLGDVVAFGLEVEVIAFTDEWEVEELFAARLALAVVDFPEEDGGLDEDFDALFACSEAAEDAADAADNFKLE